MDRARKAGIIRPHQFFDLKTDGPLIRPLGAELLGDNADIVLGILEVMDRRRDDGRMDDPAFVVELDIMDENAPGRLGDADAMSRMDLERLRNAAPVAFRQSAEHLFAANANIDKLYRLGNIVQVGVERRRAQSGLRRSQASRLRQIRPAHVDPSQSARSKRLPRVSAA